MCDGDSTHNHMSRRNLMLGTGVLAATAIVATSASGQTASPSADASGNQLTVNKADTAVVFIDPQNDVLSEKGVNWGAVGASVTENHTVENMAKIFEAAKSGGYHVFISPHYFYPTDVNQWKFIDPLESEEQPFVRSKRSVGSGRLQRLRRRLARPVQALYRGRKDNCR
jgi:isochorismatase family protein